MKLLHIDPALRLTASEAMQHPWCSGSTFEEFQEFHLSQHDNITKPADICRTPSGFSSYRVASPVNTPHNRVTNLVSNSDTPPSTIERVQQNESQAEQTVIENTRSVNRRLIYNQASILEQQRAKEAEAMELLSRNLSRTHMNGSNEENQRERARNSDNVQNAQESSNNI